MIDLQKQKQDRIALASKQQRLAADPKVSVWVEASAGTGKTKVLSDRVLQLLLGGVNPSKILCLTYTKAAAVEMSNRIASRLSKWAVTDDEKLEAELENLLGAKGKKIVDSMAKARRLFATLLDTPGGVKIQTIHSFCQEILKRFPLEAKISPYFEVMDDRGAKDALQSIKEDILKGNLDKKAAESLAFLTAAAGEYKFPLIMQAVTENRNMIEAYLQKFGSVENIINNVEKFVGVSLKTTKAEVEADFWNCLQNEKVSIVVKALASGTEKAQEKSFDLAKAAEDKNFDVFCALMLTDGRPRKDLLGKKIREAMPQAEQAVNDIMAETFEALQKIKAVNLLASTNAVLVLADEMLKRYQHYKNQKSKMDYNDLIMLTKKLLQTPKVADWVLFKLDGGIDNVLIDEAQDTSPEQWAIVKALTEEFFSGKGSKDKQPTIFVVGDRKQSIYSFQGADPAEFEKMHDYFADTASEFRDVNMEVSFRSTAAILDTVNEIFASDKARSGVAKASQNIAHVPARIGDGGRVEIWPLVEDDKDNNTDKIWLPPVERVSAVSSSAKLAKRIAENIKQKVKNKELLKSKGRPLTYGDFLILVQRRNSFVEEIVRACKNEGVKITGVDKIKLQEQIVVDDLLALAKFALLPTDDLNLACLLKSPLFGIGEDDLFDLCYNRGEKTVWQRMQENPKHHKYCEILHEVIALGKRVRPFEFFSSCLNENKGRKKFIERLGEDCKDALDEFMNLTLDFERENVASLQLFVEWLEKDEVIISRNLEQNNNDAVRLMTVHGSKGLQAPVVILPDTLRVKTVSQDARWLADESVLMFPLGKDFYTEKCSDMVDREKELSLEEYHRLLYVALTRAEECLCICGFKKKNKPNENCWYEICREAFEKIAKKDENKGLCYEVEQFVLPPEYQQKDNVQSKKNIPDWILTEPERDGLLAKPLAPSHQDESKVAVLSPLVESNDTKLYNRGRIIHKILQFLPDTKQDKRSQIIEDFLQKQASDFDLAERQKIKTEVLNLLNDEYFAPLFSENSAAEVSLMGLVEDRIISGQIDRLVVTGNKVMIVDYKTNRPAAKTLNDVPKAYVKQMRAYKKLVENIYENKEVETYILWTNTAKMMKID